MIQLLVSIFIWLAVWIGAWRVFYGPMAAHGINYIDRFPVTAGYFSVLSAAIVLIFRDTFAGFAGHVTPAPFVVLASAVLAQIFLYRVAAGRLERPDELIRRNPREMFLTLDFRYLFSKSAELMFQQVMIVLLVWLGWRQTGNVIGATVVFGTVFALGHLPLLALFGDQSGRFARMYIGAALASALVFPVLILEVDFGFVYTYIIHSLFFTLLGIWFWRR